MGGHEHITLLPLLLTMYVHHKVAHHNEPIHISSDGTTKAGFVFDSRNNRRYRRFYLKEEGKVRL